MSVIEIAPFSINTADIHVDVVDPKANFSTSVNLELTLSQLLKSTFENRKMLIKLGMVSNSMFDQIQPAAVDSVLNDMFAEELITLEERDNINNMINSPDTEAVTLGYEMIRKKNENK